MDGENERYRSVSPFAKGMVRTQLPALKKRKEKIFLESK